MNNSHPIILIVVGVTVLILLLLLIILWIIIGFQKLDLLNRLHLNTLQAKNDRKLVTAMLEMQELTFQQIAREVHDNIKLSLILSRLNLYALIREHEIDPEQKLAGSIDLLEKAIQDLGHIAGSLNAESIRGLGLGKTLEKEMDRLRITGLYTIHTNIQGKQVILEAERELQVFRIVQEAVSNCIQHAEATTISLSVQYYTDQLFLIISDDGKGFNYAGAGCPATGTGLMNMRVRAKALNGKLTITSEPGKGTSVCVEVPIGGEVAGLDG